MKHNKQDKKQWKVKRKDFPVMQNTVVPSMYK